MMTWGAGLSRVIFVGFFMDKGGDQMFRSKRCILRRVELKWLLIIVIGLVGGCQRKGSSSDQQAEKMNKARKWLSEMPAASWISSRVPPGAESKWLQEQVELMDQWFQQGSALPELEISLRRMLEVEKDHDVRAKVVGTLGMLQDKQSVALLIEILKSESEDWSTRAWAGTALHMIGDPAAIDALGGVLHDPNANLRAAVCQSLAGFTGAKVEGYLQEALQDEADFVRSSAESSLKEVMSRKEEKDK